MGNLYEINVFAFLRVAGGTALGNEQQNWLSLFQAELSYPYNTLRIKVDHVSK